MTEEKGMRYGPIASKSEEKIARDEDDLGAYVVSPIALWRRDAVARRKFAPLTHR